MTEAHARLLASRIGHINGMLYGGTHPELLDASAALMDAAAEISRLQADLKHWQANHANLVEKNAFLSQRPDLPVDRIPAYASLVHAREFVRIQEGRIDVLTNLLRDERTQQDALRARLGVALEPRETLNERLAAAIDTCREQAQVLARQSDWK